MWFIGVEVEQETSTPPPKQNPGSAPELSFLNRAVSEPCCLRKPDCLNTSSNLPFLLRKSPGDEVVNQVVHLKKVIQRIVDVFFNNLR